MNPKRMRPVSFKIRDVTYQTNSINGDTPYHITMAELGDDDEWHHVWDDGRDGIEGVVRLVSELIRKQKRRYKELTDEEVRILIDER